MFQLLNCPLINQLELKEMVYRAAWWGVLSRELMWSISLGCDCCGKRISGSAQFFHNRRSVRSFRGSTSTECYATARAARHRTLNPVCTSIPFLEWWLRWFCRRNIIGCWLAWCMPPPPQKKNHFNHRCLLKKDSGYCGIGSVYMPFVKAAV